MFDRLFSIPLNNNESAFIFGPRGTGKTKWLITNLQEYEYTYLDLLDASIYRQLQGNPEKLREFIRKDKSTWTVIDEVQKIPEILDEVHRLIEHDKRKFILTGSSARKLKKEGVNLLAGRAIEYRMHPLTYQELGTSFDIKHALTFGMLPATYTYSDPEKYLKTYLTTYLKEEVMQEGLTRNIGAFSRFLETASYSQGSTINSSEIAREIGVNRSLVQGYFSILYDLLLAKQLPAFTKRAKRRLVTADKFYYFDTGVYQQLRPKGILDAPSEIAGAALETLFFQSASALIDYNNLNTKLYYWKTSSGTEVDFIFYGSNNLLAFEIKHAKVITPRMLNGLKQFKIDYPMAKLYVIYLGEKTLTLAKGEITALPITEALKQLPELLSLC